MSKSHFIHRTRVFLDQHIEKLLVYFAAFTVIFGVYLILNYDIKARPLFGLLGILLILVGPFFVGLIFALFHKIFIRLDKRKN